MKMKTKMTNRKSQLCSDLCCITKKCHKMLRNRSVRFCCRGNTVPQNITPIVEYTSKVDAEIMSHIVDDCMCDLKMRTTEKVWNLDQEPAMLQYFDLPQCTLDFILSLTPAPPVEVPALPKHRRKDMTLVLDLDETLVHSTLKFTDNADFKFVINVPEAGPRTVYVKTRPGLTQFLHYASSLFEIVVFTASPTMYANRVFDLIDPERSLIDHRMFRHHCHLHQGNYVKDLSALGRDLSKVVIIDNAVEAMGFQLHNGILIESFMGSSSDTSLQKMKTFLHMMNQAVDVRDAVVQYYEMFD
eukprot:GFUD01016555.1.p1 GENE.GFUD01016555.1~~GFUD01016555.1.p1  ORF type:complete len:307 (-),score=52.06 GFUD01016555.1:16-915(-)